MGIFSKIGAALLKAKGAVMATTATKVVTVAVAATVVVGGTVGVTQMEVFASPEKKIENALASLMENEESAFEKLFGWDEFFREIEENGLEADVNFTLEDIPVDELGISIPNIGMGLNYRYDEKSGRMELSAGAKVADTTLLSADLYLDEEKVLASVPELFNGAIGANYAQSDFMEQLKKSELIQMLGEEFAQILEEIPDTLTEVKDSAETAALVKETLDALEESKKEFMASMKAKKDGGAAKVLVGEKEVTCTVYTATFGPEETEAFLIALIDSVTEFLEAYAAENPDTNVADILEELKLRSGSENFSEEAEKFKEELKGMIAGTELSVYLDGKRMVLADLQVTWEEADFNLNVLFGTEGNRYDNMELVLDMTKYGETLRLLELSHKTTETETAFSSVWSISAEAEEMVTLTFEYEKSAGDFLFELALPSEYLSFAVEGVLTIPEQGGEFSFELNDLSMTEFGEKHSLGLKTEISLRMFEGEIAEQGEIAWDVVNMSALEWERLSTEITGNIYALVMKLMFGG